MQTKGLFKLLLVILLITVNVGCDQVSKKIVRDKVTPLESISVIGSHLTLIRVENTGAFLSMGDELPATAKNILLSVLPLLVLAFIFIYAITKNIAPTPLAGLCCIIGGGLGNIFDRVLYGSVTDFLHIDFGLFRTGIFNMADVSVMTGTLIILFHSFFKKKNTTPASLQ